MSEADEPQRDDHRPDNHDEPLPSHEPAEPVDVWADLVARLEATDSSSIPDPEPDGAAGPDAPGVPPVGGAPFPSLAQPPVGPLAPRGPRDWDEPDEDALADAEAGQDFVPETPGPILVGRPSVVIACIAAVALPVLMLVLLILVPDRVPTTGWATMGLAEVVALVYLGWSLPRHRSDDGDDGARV